jgi:Ca2+-transporting ATPase
MLWINLIMDTFAALALATEPPDNAVMSRPPRKSGDFIVTPMMARGIFGVGGVFIVVLIAFLLLIQRNGVTAYELSAFYTTFVMLQFWNLFNARRLGSNRSALSAVAENTLFLIIAASIFVGQVIITQFGGRVFSTVPLSLRDWILIVVGTSVVLWIGEIWRAMRRARR